VAIVLPELDVEKVRRWCRDRVPAKFADQVRLEVSTRGKSISIHECRPVWRGAPGDWTKTAIAQIRYEGDGTWTLYFGDRYGRCTSTSTPTSPSLRSSMRLAWTPPASSGVKPSA
jgi:hypothetical protein